MSIRGRLRISEALEHLRAAVRRRVGRTLETGATSAVRIAPRARRGSVRLAHWWATVIASEAPLVNGARVRTNIGGALSVWAARLTASFRTHLRQQAVLSAQT